MEFLVDNKVMVAKEVASVFGPSLVAPDSHFQDKVYLFVAATTKTRKNNN